VLFDIGGGSSELVRLDRSHETRRGPPLPRIRGWVSLPHGVVTLAERHGGINVSRDTYEVMVAEVAALIAPFAREHGGEGLRGIHMLGTSGTVTTIAGVHLNLKRYDRNRVDGCWLSEQEIDAALERLLAMSYDERVASPCIGPERADLVLAGCAILEAIRRAFPCPRLRVADRGLREGMLVQMMRDDGAWGDAASNGGTWDGGSQTAPS
jgi:exopolyphosphatase/guanosine-5'-triphosphate,3'-diphosphate pyrophosphatase